MATIEEFNRYMRGTVYRTRGAAEPEKMQSEIDEFQKRLAAAKIRHEQRSKLIDAGGTEA